MRLALIKEEISKYNENNLSEVDLLKVLLGEKTLDILIDYGLDNLKKISSLSDKDLLNINNIGKETILKIRAITEIGQRQIFYNTDNKITAPSDVNNLCKDMISMEQEVLRLFCLNTKNQVIYKSDVYKGGLNSSIVHPREIYKEALKRSSASIVIAHNHPSGDTSPSREDIDITKRLKQAGEIIGITLIDHIIIGSNGYVSLKEKEII